MGDAVGFSLNHKSIYQKKVGESIELVLILEGNFGRIINAFGVYIGYGVKANLFAKKTKCVTNS